MRHNESIRQLLDWSPIQLGNQITAALYFRGIGELAVVSTLPSVIVVLFAAVTQLADTWFVFGLLSALYIWPMHGLRRRDSVRLIALALVAAAAVLTLKVGIGLARPPGSTAATVPGWLPWPLSEAFRSVATDDGFGFPSGHATAATVLYGGLAATLEWRSRQTRMVIAGITILAVMCSRVVLGVHFLVDVLVGGVLGASLLWIGLDRGEPTHWFGVAAVIAVIGGVVGTLQGHPETVHDATIGMGSAIGGSVGWYLMTRIERARRVTVRPIAGIATGGLGASLWLIAYVFGGQLTAATTVGSALALLASMAMAAVAIGIIVGLPAMIARWEHR